jgi:hypothetical protein
MVNEIISFVKMFFCQKKFLTSRYKKCILGSMLNDLPRLTRSTAFVMTPLANTDRHRRDGTAGTQEGCELRALAPMA